LYRERPAAVLLGTVDDGIHGRWLRRWLKLPYAVFAHGNEIVAAASGNQQDGRPKLLRAILSEASRVMAISRFTADLVEQAGVDPRRIDLIHPGCDSGFFSPRPPDAGLRQRLLGGRRASPIILTTGNLVPRKGHDVVIQALPHLVSTLPDVAYLIVGDGPNRGELERLATDLGVRDRVIFAGRTTDAELPAVYSLCDVFVMASRTRADLNDVEGFGLVFLEAGACGKPVIGGRSGGIPDAIVEGESGLLVDPLDPRDVAAALHRVLVDADFATRLGTQGRKRVVRDFTWAGFARKVQVTLEHTARP
jgi:phosphatidylinositol alpha-1,6-mannosyltransferase